ncbi:MAG: site-specific DNA-methyltransferase, partial [Rhodospirillaceae bacterium]|nr:site-specific DNA-methyltransferase [Rhodospirillaceae bacterium]
VAEKIIALLAQLEDFQKRFWLKKKFVLETQWCVTLDRVPETLYPEIAANDAQRREWVDLFAIDEIVGDLGNGGEGYEEPISATFFETNPHLVLDKRHFDADFRDRLLTALSDSGPLDERTNGLLIHGENFQALNLLRARYSGQVRCVYIDPPYNTDASAILYKNNYKNSSWLSLAEDRLSLARNFLTREGIVCVAIDDEEVALLRLVMESLFEKQLGIVPVRSNPAGRKSRGQFSPAHEYALFFGRENSIPGTLDKTAKELARYPHSDESGRFAWNNLIRHGSGDRRQDRPTMFFPIYVRDDDSLRVPAMRWDPEKEEYTILEEPTQNEAAVWPIKREGSILFEKRWHRGPKAVAENPSDYRVRRNDNSDDTDTGISIDFKIRIDLDSMPKTWWDDKGYASANLGPRTLKELFKEKDFDFSKAVRLVEDALRASCCTERSIALDFFAGSGTTGHAVINLNREDGGERRYILVEMGDHFDTVMLSRLKKVAYSPDWKAGKPVVRDKGVSHLIHYVRLESYEDTLDGLVLTPPSGDLLAANDRDLIEDYRLRYALDGETAGSPCLLGGDFADPFTYTLSVVRDGGRRDALADLPETFNFLIGLRVESRRLLDGVLAIAGTDAQGRRCLILWRNLQATDNRGLNGWFTEHRARLPTPLDLVYVNGDHTLNAIRQPGEIWTAETIEPLFRELMFETDER